MTSQYPTSASSVAGWLSDLNLSQYTSHFTEQGFDDVGLISQLNAEDLDQLGIKLVGHRKKLLLASLALRGGAPSSSVSTSAPSSSSSTASSALASASPSPSSASAASAPSSTSASTPSPKGGNENNKTVDHSNGGNETSEARSSTDHEAKEQICFFCKKAGHIRKDCESRIASKTCYNCGNVGHEAKNCEEEPLSDSEKECFNCNEIGHLARNCPLESKRPVSSRSQQRFFGTRGRGGGGFSSRGRRGGRGGNRGGHFSGKLECFTCHQEGHKAVDCPQRAAHENGASSD